MNLYDLHKDRTKLKYHDVADEQVPKLVWDKYEHQPKELKKREDILAKDPEIAYWYATIILEGRFPKGEDAIAKDPKWAYRYARFVIKGKWAKGEDAIAKDPKIAYSYAFNVVKGRFPKGEDAIKQNKNNWKVYQGWFPILYRKRK